jgi:pentatricopeptide repeat protein
LLYRSYVRSKSELAAQTHSGAPSDGGISKAATEHRTRQQRLAALQKKRQEMHVRRTESASKGVHTSFGVIKRMHEREIRVDEVCYRSLMEMCGCSKLADTAKLVFEDMKNHEVVPDTISYNAFVQAIIKDEDDFGGHKFKSFRHYRCLGEEEQETGGASEAVRLKLTASNGRWVDHEDEQLILATWALQGRSYEEWCEHPLYRYNTVYTWCISREMQSLPVRSTLYSHGVSYREGREYSHTPLLSTSRSSGSCGVRRVQGMPTAPADLRGGNGVGKIVLLRQPFHIGRRDRGTVGTLDR